MSEGAEAHARSRRAASLFAAFGGAMLFVLGFAAVLLPPPLNVIAMPVLVGTAVSVLFWACSPKMRTAMRGGSGEYFLGVLLRIGIPHMAIQAGGSSWILVFDHWHPEGWEEISGLVLVQMGVLLAFVPYFFAIGAIPALKGLWRDFEAAWKASRAVQGEAV